MVLLLSIIQTDVSSHDVSTAKTSIIFRILISSVKQLANNARKVFNQALKFRVKNVIITDKKKYLSWKKIFNKHKINTYKNSIEK